MQNIALIGFGFMGGMHAQIYGQLADARVVAIVDERRRQTVAKAAKLGLDVPVFPDLASCLAECAIDVVDICLPTDLHREAALEALAAGKALFCEKPLARTRDQARDLVQAAQDAGVPVQVGHCIRFWPEYRAFARFLERGEGGELKSLTLQRRTAPPSSVDAAWLHSEERSGGAALDLHIHDTDFILSLFGKPRAVTSRATFGRGGPSHIFTDYDYENKIVRAEGGWNYPSQWGFRMAFQAVFENAAVEYDSAASPTLTLTLGEGAPQPMPFESPIAGRSSSGEGNISDLGGYYNELRYFIDCLESGHKPDQSTFEHAAASLDVVLAEIDSARMDESVPVGISTGVSGAPAYI